MLITELIATGAWVVAWELTGLARGVARRRAGRRAPSAAGRRGVTAQPGGVAP